MWQSFNSHTCPHTADARAKPRPTAMCIPPRQHTGHTALAGTAACTWACIEGKRTAMLPPGAEARSPLDFRQALVLRTCDPWSMVDHRPETHSLVMGAVEAGYDHIEVVSESGTSGAARGELSGDSGTTAGAPPLVMPEKLLGAGSSRFMRPSSQSMMRTRDSVFTS